VSWIDWIVTGLVAYFLAGLLAVDHPFRVYYPSKWETFVYYFFLPVFALVFLLCKAAEKLREVNE